MVGMGLSSQPHRSPLSPLAPNLRIASEQHMHQYSRLSGVENKNNIPIERNTINNL